MHVGLDINTKIYIANLYNDENDPDVWNPIYFGPQVMEFDCGALKFYRKENNYTQEDVAKAVGVNLRTYQNWEAGVGCPDGFNLIRIMNNLLYFQYHELLR